MELPRNYILRPHLWIYTRLPSSAVFTSRRNFEFISVLLECNCNLHTPLVRPSLAARYLVPPTLLNCNFAEKKASKASPVCSRLSRSQDGTRPYAERAGISFLSQGGGRTTSLSGAVQWRTECRDADAETVLVEVRMRVWMWVRLARYANARISDVKERFHIAAAWILYV